ncbi:MAG TPA: ABC transporter permease [Tepidisphaeraceae bacterium]|nr:ABC transporter permease [Tepidisphaeraceae bacterium]
MTQIFADQRKTGIWARSDAPFFVALGVIGATYVFLIVAMLGADVAYTSVGDMGRALESEQIRFAIKLSLISCTVTAVLSVIVGVPLGYLLSSRGAIEAGERGGALEKVLWFLRVGADAIVDIPIVLPPLVIGLSLLILFQTAPGRWVQHYVTVSYAIPAVIIAQFSVACAFAVRTMRVTFDQISPRSEQVAMTLGCTRGQAFWRVAIPEAWHGIITAGTIAWARAMGEFGPILVFAGATRMRTEVLPTTVFLELSVGKLESAVAVSLIMVVAAMVVLLIVRLAGGDPLGRVARA